VGLTYGKQNKSKRLFDKLFGKSFSSSDTFIYRKLPPVPTVQKIDSSRYANNLIVDYKNGKIYSDPQRPAAGNIIIVNNNYYYRDNIPEISAKHYAVIDTIKTDSVNLNMLKLKSDSPSKKIKSDSLSKVLTDSINQKRIKLDSMINQLQQLRLEMDSAKKSDTLALGIYYRRMMKNRVKDSVAAVQLANSIYYNDSLRPKNIMMYDTATGSYRQLNKEDSVVLVKTDPLLNKNIYYDTILKVKLSAFKKKLLMAEILL
jgi:hypothetical protein